MSDHIEFVMDNANIDECLSEHCQGCERWLPSSVTGCVTKGNYVHQHYDVAYVLLAVSTSGKRSKGGGL
jgi:hypothetical protein